MRRPPRRPGAPILGEYALWRIAFVSVLIGGMTIAVFLFEERQGYSYEMAQTMAVNTLVLGQLFYLFNSRFLRESSLRLDLLFTNRVVWIAVGVLVVLQLLFVYVPFLNLWFHSAPIPLGDWLLPIGIGFAIFLSCRGASRLPFAHCAGVTGRQVWIVQVGSDVGLDLP